jgi:membrane-associated phospholipid phosphatase
VTRRQLLVLAAAAALATALALALIDEPAARWIAAHDQSPWWDRAIAVLEVPLGIEPWKWTMPLVLVAGVAACLAVPRLRPAARSWMYVALVFLLAKNLTLWIKTFTGRLRPGEWLAAGGATFGHLGDGIAFPSGHVVVAAGLLLPLAVIAPRRPWLTALIGGVIGLVMIARVAVGAHFMSDVLGGLALVALLAAACAPLVTHR